MHSYSKLWTGWLSCHFLGGGRLLRLQGTMYWIEMHVGTTWRIQLKVCLAAMQPYVKLLWPIVYFLVEFFYGANNDSRNNWCWGVYHVAVTVGVSWNVMQTAFQYPVKRFSRAVCDTHTHTYTRLTALFSGTTQVSRYQKGKTNLDFTEARDSEWQWIQLGHMQVCTSLQRDNHASTPPLSFYRPDALPAAQPTASKHWRQLSVIKLWK